MNRAQRRAAGWRTRRIRVGLAEWLQEPEKVVTRGEVLLLLEMHEKNMHKRQRWLGRIFDMIRKRPTEEA